MKYWITFLACLFSLANGGAHENRSGNSLASLIFYLNEQAEIKVTDDLRAIAFDDEDVSALWNHVFSQKAFFAEEAYSLYRQATDYNHQGDEEGARPLFRQASDYLQLDWEALQWTPPSYNAIFHKSSSWKDLETYPQLDEKARKRIFSYLLPSTNAIKPALDAIFHRSRAIFSDETLQSAGFTIKFSQPRSFIRVVSHPSLPGYLLKAYLDSDQRIKRDTPGWEWFVRRCEGAKRIRDIISRNKLKYFTVAKKWIYVLPLSPAPPLDPSVDPKPVVLVVEDMNLVPKTENKEIWKNQITKKHLDELYSIVSQAGGSSYRPDNIHYTQSGKFAFIDTEYPQRTPDYNSIRPYLSAEMRDYWDYLVKRGGLVI